MKLQKFAIIIIKYISIIKFKYNIVNYHNLNIIFV